MRKHFGTDGIRGRANGVITPELALKVGQAAGLLFQRGDHRHRVVIGKDTRLSGYMIETALVAGFTSVGMDVLQLGPMPTPAVAMLTRSMRADLGVMISASHNPYDDNGIKLFGPDAFKLSDEVESEIEALLASDLSEPPRRLAPSRPRQAHRGRPRPLHRVRQAHAAAQHHPGRPARRGRLRQRRRLQGRARGAVGARRGGDPDRRRAGRLQHQPRRRLDGAGGARRARCASCAPTSASRSTATPTGCSSSTRRAAWSTATSSWPWWPAPGATTGGCRSPASSRRSCRTSAWSASSTTLGLALVRTAVGDRYVLEHMREHGYNLGGEQSGHIILSDYTTTGDGLIAALQLLTVVKRLGKPVSEVCHCFEPLPQVLKNVRYRERPAAADGLGRDRDRVGAPAPRQGGPAGDPPVRHRAGDPRHGRGGRPRSRQSRGRRRGRRRLQGGRLRGGSGCGRTPLPPEEGHVPPHALDLPGSPWVAQSR